MPKQVIEHTDIHTPSMDISANLAVSELFYDTIQGEGIYTGHPAVFLRLMNCTLNCSWCDTEEVWRQGNMFTFAELFDRIESTPILNNLKRGDHLVITGGSPLLQQVNLYWFIKDFIKRYGFKPFIEIENEAVLPVFNLDKLIDCWNNSPKLSNSGNSELAMFKPKVIKKLSSFDNSWFKFVITKRDDWEEIERKFIKTRYIRKDQIILMPEGSMLVDLEINQINVVNLAIKHGVRYSTRQHIVLWDKATGV